MKFTGTKSAQLQIGRAWDPRTGGQFVMRWRGPSDELAVLYDQYIAAGAKAQLDPSQEGGYGLLTVTLGAEATQPLDQPLTNRWKLVPNDLEKSIWQHPKVKAAFPGAGASVFAGLRKAVEDVLANEVVTDGVTSVQVTLDTVKALYASEYPGAPELIEHLVEELALLSESFPVSQFVLLNVLIIASNSSIKATWENVGKIYSTAELKAAESIPDNVQFDMPEGYWLKRAPLVDDGPDGKWVITRQWWHADAYSWFYDRAI